MKPNDNPDIAALMAPIPRPTRPDITRAVCRGVCRLLYTNGFACVPELPLPDGRRADIVALSDTGTIWIIEVKSSLEDFRVDQKWIDYKAFADEFFFAVDPGFPQSVLPPDEGLILADKFGGEIVRRNPSPTRLAGARRTALTRRFGRYAALRLQAISDPDFVREIGAVIE